MTKLPDKAGPSPMNGDDVPGIKGNTEYCRCECTVTDKKAQAHEKRMWQDYENELARVKALLAAREAEIERTKEQLKDPRTVSICMLRGTIAKPSPEGIRHLYGGKLDPDALAKTLKALQVLVHGAYNHNEFDIGHLTEAAHLLKIHGMEADPNA